MYQYLQNSKQIFKKIMKKNKHTLKAAINLLTANQKEQGKIFVFGSGHSHMLAEEFFYRAGGLALVQPILIEPLMLHQEASASSKYEQKNNFVKSFLKKYQLTKHDVVIIFSNSGKNPAGIDVALWAQEKQVPIIAITAKSQQHHHQSLHQSQKLLADLADVVIDNCTAYGDTVLMEKGYHFGSLSSLSGIAIVQTLITETIKKLIQDEQEVLIWRSGNVLEYQAHNKKLLAKLKTEIIHL